MQLNKISYHIEILIHNFLLQNNSYILITNEGTNEPASHELSAVFCSYLTMA